MASGTRPVAPRPRWRYRASFNPMERDAPLFLHHLALGARDVERVASFYQDVFGLQELTRHHTEEGRLRSVWLRLGDAAVLMIERTEAALRRDPTTVGAGLFLMAFRIEPSQRSAWEERLEQAGAPVEARTASTSYARDPEGNRFAISFYPLDHVRRHTR